MTKDEYIKHYKENYHAYADKLVLIKMGDFYNAMFSNAWCLSKIMNITLLKYSGVEFSGIPAHCLDDWIKILENKGVKIIIIYPNNDKVAA